MCVAGRGRVREPENVFSQLQLWITDLISPMRRIQRTYHQRSNSRRCHTGWVLLGCNGVGGTLGLLLTRLIEIPLGGI